MDPLVITQADAATDDVAALLAHHVAIMQAGSPPESCHVMAGAALSEPGVMLLALRDSSGVLLGVGALKEIGDGLAKHGEIKSMHTASDARGRGVGAALLRALIANAEKRGMSHVSLETGSGPAFAAARRLYHAHGFEVCEPFGTYVADPFSVYMTRRIGVSDADR